MPVLEQVLGDPWNADLKPKSLISHAKVPLHDNRTSAGYKLEGGDLEPTFCDDPQDKIYCEFGKDVAFFKDGTYITVSMKLKTNESWNLASIENGIAGPGICIEEAFYDYDSDLSRAGNSEAYRKLITGIMPTLKSLLKRRCRVVLNILEDRFKIVVRLDDCDEQTMMGRYHEVCSIVVSYRTGD
jgi:hypothetical protein